MMAMTAAMAIGRVADANLILPSDKIVEALKTFRNAPHRLEKVRTLGGVDYVNDSKATNVDAAWYALEAQTRPVVWIAGARTRATTIVCSLTCAVRRSRRWFV